MIKAICRGQDGRTVIMIGISATNVARLRAGQPIYFDPAVLKLGPDEKVGGITLFYAETDAGLMDAIRESLQPHTEVIVVPKGDSTPQ